MIVFIVGLRLVGMIKSIVNLSFFFVYAIGFGKM